MQRKSLVILIAIIALSSIGILLFLKTRLNMIPPALQNQGINGIIAAGPMCPVIKIDKPCPDKPYVGKLSIYQNSQFIEETQTDDKGAFRVYLSPGKYNIQNPKGNKYPYFSKEDIIVEPDKMTQVSIEADTGIR